MVLGVAVAAVLSLTLSGCTGTPAPTATTPSASSAPDPSKPPTPSAPSTPTLDPEGDASDNLDFFTSIIEGVWTTADAAAGRAYVDALVAGGFDKSTMQVTKDLSTVGNAAESMQVSVLWQGECLVGQFGPATGTPHTIVQEALPRDLCLVGNTRPIDW